MTAFIVVCAVIGLLVGFLAPLPIQECPDGTCGVCRWVFLPRTFWRWWRTEFRRGWREGMADLEVQRRLRHDERSGR